MKETPIIFSTPMVKAIIDGRKTQTRRVVKSERISNCKVAEQAADGSWIFWGNESRLSQNTKRLYPDGGFKCPYGKAGDRLWVRETFVTAEHYDEPRENSVVYRADGDPNEFNGEWKPSIFMPKRFARIWLEITGVRVERLQDISEEGAWAEGINEQESNKFPYINKYGVGCAVATFSNLWEKINGKKHPWSSNPWVWVIEFKRSSK